MFQVAMIFSGDGTFIVTVHVLEPVTATLRLYRSLHDWPAESVTVQLPPPPPPPPPVGATARPVCGEIMPAHRPRLARPCAMRGIADSVLAGHSCIRMTCPLVSR